jgi:hypothetical protein
MNTVKKCGADPVGGCLSQNENELIKRQYTQDEQFSYTKMYVCATKSAYNKDNTLLHNHHLGAIR